jgi:hypothetical protein
MISVGRIDEMQMLFREAWELFYWSLWFPSRLQKRMNLVYGSEKRASGLDVLLPTSPKQWHFLEQYVLVSLIMLVPIIILSIRLPAPINWLLPVGAFMTSFGISCWFLPTGIGWSSPLLFALIACQNPILLMQNYGVGLAELSKVFPPLSHLGVGIVILTLSSSLGFSQVLGSSVSVFTGIWLATRNLPISFLFAVLIGLFLSTFREEIDNDSVSLRESLAVGMIGGIICGIVIGCGVGVAIADLGSIDVYQSFRPGISLIISTTVVILRTYALTEFQEYGCAKMMG